MRQAHGSASNLSPQTEFLLYQLSAYDKLEQWGASLFLAAIAIVTKYLFEWYSDLTYQIPEHALIIPLLIGIVGFVFLRIVNLGSHTVQLDLNRDVDKPRLSPRRNWLSWLPKPFGSLGWLIAAMPPVFGFLLSWFLTSREYEVRRVVTYCGFGGLMVVVSFLFHHIWRRRELQQESNVPGGSQTGT